MSIGPPAHLCLVQCYINIHRTISISVSCTMLSQRPTTTTTIQHPLDHHVCVLYNPLTRPYNYHYYIYVNVHWNTSISMSRTTLSQGPTMAPMALNLNPPELYQNQVEFSCRVPHVHQLSPSLHCAHKLSLIHISEPTRR